MFSLFTVEGEGMKGILRRGHPGALSSVPIPSPHSLGLDRALRPVARTKPDSFCAASSLSPDSCHLLTFCTERQWRGEERGTGADWCLYICQWRFLSLPFSSPRLVYSPPSRLDKAVHSKRGAHYCSLFSSKTQTARARGETCYI